MRGKGGLPLPIARTSPGLSNNARHELMPTQRHMRGTALGYSRNTSTGVQRAFVAYNDGSMYDVITKVNNPSGWALSAAEGINTNGWIVGWGYKGGQTRAFVLAPNQ